MQDCKDKYALHVDVQIMWIVLLSIQANVEYPY